MDALVDDFAARRRAGLEQVYALWSRLFFSVARYALADDARAEDCVHDALLRVWRTPNRFTGNREMLKAYLVACVRNESLLMLRSQSRRDERERKAARLAPPAAVDPPVVDPVETERLRRALARLPEEQRAALDLAYYGNKTHVEIAQETGIPLGTIKSRISMAMRKLHEELAADGGAGA
ncbi:MAG: RNA polymerase sigma factor [Vulcanimicrobiaceae bacterium]